MLDQRVLIVLLEDDVVLPPVDAHIGRSCRDVGSCRSIVLQLLLPLLRGQVGPERALLLQEALLEVQQAAVLVLTEAVPEGG